MELPISEAVAINFYFAVFMFAASILLLAAIYLYRWKSEVLSCVLWALAYMGAFLFAWKMVGNIHPLALVIIINCLAFLIVYRLAPIISYFGVFFLISMISPAILGLIWFYELTRFAWDIELDVFEWSLTLFVALGVALLFFINVTIASLMALVRFSELYFLFPRRIAALAKATEFQSEVQPWVSIHVPCYAEPPEIVINNLNALSHMKYQNFEVIVIDNNTKDPNLWKPVEEHCRRLGSKFNFYHFDSVKGAKAGALNIALSLTRPEAEIIGVLDADYESNDNFLQKLVPYFADPTVGFVQACHDYRGWENNRYLSNCYYEYEMHFKQELPSISEWDAAYTVGTMCLLRRKVIENAGGWAEWCLTEDSEIAVRVHNMGYKGYYLNDSYGKGLIPETFEDYKKQRFRWFAGPVQQLKKHWRLYMPWSNKGNLTLIQKLAEIFHSSASLFTGGQFLLTALPLLLICTWFAIFEDMNFTIPPPLLVFIPLAVIQAISASWIRVKMLGGTWKDYIGSSIAKRSLNLTALKACYFAWFTPTLRWNRTEKFKAAPSFSRALQSSYCELIVGLVYLVAALLLAPLASFMVPDILCLAFFGMLNQSLTYLCAPLMAFLAEREIVVDTAVESKMDKTT